MSRLLLLSSLLLAACGRHGDSRFGYTDSGQGTDLKPVDNSVEARLLVAIESDDQAAATEILNSGFNVNTPLKTGRTALLEAVNWSRAELVQFFLDKGADRDFKGPDGKTALDLAADKPAILKILQPGMGEELQKRFLEAIRTNNYNDVKEALSEGADPNRFDADGETPLTLAIQLKFENVVRVLLQPSVDIDVNLKNKKQESPLALARKLGLQRIERMLLQKGATE